MLRGLRMPEPYESTEIASNQNLLRSPAKFLLIIFDVCVTIRCMFQPILRCGLACLLIVCSSQAATIFPTNSTWKYFKGTVEASSPTNAWRQIGFDDSSWPSGPTAIYYGETLTGTALNDMQGLYSCVFMRRTFDVPSVSELLGLRLNAIVDDGFVAWINGTEVFRVNMPAGEVGIGTVASAAIAVEFEVQSRVITNLASLLVEGENVIAIQAFNSSLAGSSDFMINASLDSYPFDSQGPTITSVTPASGTVSTLTAITVQFSEPISGLEAGDLFVNGISASSVIGGGTTYTFGFPQPAYGQVQISWAPTHGITDQALYPNAFDSTAPGATWTYQLIDQTPPSVASLFPPAGATVRSLGQVEVLFSEGVLGVQAADLLVNGVAATNVTQLGEGPYIFRFTPPANGTVALSWASGHGITDAALTPNNFAGGGWTCILDPNATTGDLIINEILASNQSGLTDEDGEAGDWIEIYNRGNTPVSLAGWSLSDDVDDPSRWVFPAVTLNASNYLVVFASGKDRTVVNATNRLHTNLQLTKTGEFIGLFSPDSPRVLVSGFSPFPPQQTDYSYGYDTANALRYFVTPTPGAPNGASSILSVADPVHFSVQRGFYSNAFDLHLSTPTLGAQVRYTRDGLEPTASTGLPYVGPIRLTNSTMIRAAAFRANFLPSEVQTHSYIFNATPAIRSLPVISIVTAQTNLTGPTGVIGISNVTLLADGRYVPIVTNGVTIGYHNPSLHGLAWERPVSVELIRPQDNSGFQTDCGIRVQGSDYQRPRTTPTSKFSFRFYFRGDYGPGRLDYELFPNTPVHSFDQLVLRAGFNDPSNPFIRDELTRRLSADQGQVASHGTVVNVFINGVYAGYYNPCERVHEEMLQAHHGGSDEWDVVGPSFATGAGANGVIDGERTSFVNLVNFIRGQDVLAQGIYQQVEARLDLPNFVDYCLLNVYCAMGDWPANNWRAGKDRAPGGIWRFYIWDGEWAMGIYSRLVTTNTFAQAGPGPDDSGLGSVNNSEIAQIYQRLRLNSEFRLLWADRVNKHFFNGGALTDTNILARFNELRNEMRVVLPAMDLGIQNTWVPQRRNVIFGHFNLYGLQASSNAPVFNQHGGRVAAGFNLAMTNVSGPIYYTTDGSDPRVPFTGAVSNAAQVYSVPIQILQTTAVKARSLDGTNWSALTEAVLQADSLGTPLRITEIMYNPVGGNALEYIELQNISSVSVDMGGMSFDGISFDFVDGFTLDAGERIILASNTDPGTFASVYGNVEVAGYFGGQLSNGGERLTLKDRFGNTVLSVDYDDEDLWPAGADGGGASLELLSTFGDMDDPFNWYISSNGTPGGPGTPPSDGGGLRVNEVMADPASPWVEIYNAGPGTNLVGFSLSDDGNAAKYVFSSTVLNAGAYLVLDCNAIGITLNPRGDELALYNPEGRRISAVSFGVQIPNFSLGRFETGLDPWALAIPTPGTGNNMATLGLPSAVVVNEWLADAFPGESDWIELWNPAALPVALKGAYVATTNALFQIPSRSFLAPFGFVQLFADELPGPDHLDFRLPAAGGQIVFYDQAGLEANRVQYGTQAEGVSQGRFPNGSPTISSFAGTGSPGASNYVINYSGPYINEIMARNTSAVTNSLGRVTDWIELYNPGNQAFDLSGMTLSVDVPESAQWVVPANTVMSPGSYLILSCDGSSDASVSFGAMMNVGRSLDGESGGVYLFNSAGQLVNFVEYGFQLENQSVGRIGSNWRLLTTATPGSTNSPAAPLSAVTNISLNEWMADPVKGDDWFELYNAASQPVDLGGMTLADDPTIGSQGMFRVPPLSFVPAKGWVRYIADGNSGNGFHHVNFSLDAQGEALRLYNTISTNFILVDGVYFGAQVRGVSQGRFPDGATNITTFPGSSSPLDSNYILPEHVVINEIQASAQAGEQDAVELLNTATVPVDLGGWFLSDTRTDLRKFRIPDGTVLPPAGYVAIPLILEGGRQGELVLSSADAFGNLTGRQIRQTFGPSMSGVSLGRFITSQNVDFTAMAQVTLGNSNSQPRVGPVVINEIMYNPLPWPDTVLEGDAEFIELRNTGLSTVNLYEPGNPGNTCQIRGGVEYVFPPATSVAPNGQVVLVNFDPETNNAAVSEFRAQHSLHFSIPLYGPYRGRLNNAGDEIELLMPGTTSGGTAPLIRVDYVNYGDANPWPTGADGSGLSLQRRFGSAYGNEPLNWVAGQPTPAFPNEGEALPVPVITAQPLSKTVLPDDIVDLAVEASGGGTLTYQWRLNGLEISGATGNTLRLNHVQVELEGLYDVIVANEAGSALSASALISISTPPQIAVAVQQFMVEPGANIVFSLGVRGSKPLQYQWQYEGSMIPGATNATLAVNNCQLENAGQYSVLINNAFGSAMSVGSLIVRVQPTWVQHPQTQTVVVGDDVTFRAGVIGTLPLGYRWRTNSSNIIPFPGSPILRLTNVPLYFDNMRIDCVASNLVVTNGRISNVARLFVLADADGDRLPDVWEDQYGFNPNVPGEADQDPDNDSMTNRDEFLAGTNPNDGLSYLRIDIVNAGIGANYKLNFMAVSNKSYTLQYRTEAVSTSWLRLLDVDARVTNRVVEIMDYSPARPARFYRLVTPQQ